MLITDRLAIRDKPIKVSLTLKEMNHPLLEPSDCIVTACLDEWFGSLKGSCALRWRDRDGDKKRAAQDEGAHRDHPRG